MARVYVSIPKGAILGYGGKSYTSRAELPEGATEFSVTMWANSTDEEVEAGAPARFHVYIPSLDVNMRRGLIQEAIDAARAEMMADHVWPISPKEQFEEDWEELWE